MTYIPRLLAGPLQKAAKHFPALILTGPRRSGKTTLLRKCFPAASYFLMEDPDLIARVKSDPRTFLDEVRPPVILDEIQHVPEILNYVRTRLDAKPHKAGQWFFTGSQEAPLMKRVTESMAGRAAIFKLLPLSSAESSRVNVFCGGFPEVIGHPSTADTWFRSYLQTYLERDVRAISPIKDLAVFRRFMSLLASRAGGILNRTDLAAPMGVSVPTISEWLNILELTAQIILVPPYYENFGQRLVKSPKLYFMDSGLLCFLLGIESAAALRRSPFYGPIYEGFLAGEIIKLQLNGNQREEIYYYRDQYGLEVDFIVPASRGKIVLIESKTSRTPRPEMGKSMDILRQRVGPKSLAAYLVVPPGPSSLTTTTLTKGVRVMDDQALLTTLAAARSGKI